MALSTKATVLGAHLNAAYKVVQLHLHWGDDGGPGSEHTIDGERYPMEVLYGFMDMLYAVSRYDFDYFCLGCYLIICNVILSCILFT